MLVLTVIATVVILAAVVWVAAGRGGEMPATERSDYAPLDMGPVSATDVVLLRPPTALWGYNQQATDEALEQIAESIRERDVRIVALEQLVTDLSRQPGPPMPLGSPYTGARHARPDAGNVGPGYTGHSYGDGTSYSGVTDYPGGVGIAADETRSMTAPMTLPGADPLGAPVAESQDQGRDVPPWESGTGWPPEVAH